MHQKPDHLRVLFALVGLLAFAVLARDLILGLQATNYILPLRYGPASLQTKGRGIPAYVSRS
jgi:hypothetical protein